MNLSKLLINQTRLRIVQHILLLGDASAKCLCQAMPDIPKATVYRHAKLLEDGGLLQVVKENRIRGAVEKVYTFNREGLPLSDSNTLSNLAAMYFLELKGNIEHYLQGPDVDLKRDLVFFNSTVLDVSDEEYRQMLVRIEAVVKDYVGMLPAENRIRRVFSMVSSLPTASGEGVQDEFS